MGSAGPLVIDGNAVNIPLATTEGALVASTNRGCKAVTMSGGVTTALLAKGMTRGPFIKLPSLSRSVQVRDWIDRNYTHVKQVFEATSNHIRLISIKPFVAGRYLFLRFKADTGEAMGMNMLSKATEAAINLIRDQCCPDALMTCLSGNFCTDKKAGSHLNWSDGRGYSISAEATISREALRSVSKLKGKNWPNWPQPRIY